jgi:hypothetical protein
MKDIRLITENGDTIQISELQRMILSEEDVLVVRLDMSAMTILARERTVSALKDSLKTVFPKNKVLIVDKNIELMSIKNFTGNHMSYFDRYKQTDLDAALGLVCLASSRFPNELHVFMFPTYKQAHVAARKFEVLIESIPEWAREKIRTKRATEIQFENGFAVKFINSPMHVKGLTMNGFFIAGDWKREDVEYIAPCLHHCATVMRIK